MANITVSTSSNLDSAANLALGNSENITIDSGATLTINSDNRWSQQAAIPEQINISATTGGECLVDGRDVWWMAYDAATGNVPTLGTAGVQNCTGGTSGATGEFLGVFTALGVAPSTAGGAMPATGFLKFRSKVGTFQDNETVTLPDGATVAVNSATGGARGWISVVMEELSTAVITVPRLGAFRTRGDWFYLGTTNGTDDQTFQFPVADRCPAIQVETASGSGVYEWWCNAGDRWGAATVVISTDARGKFFGDTTAGVITIARRASNACGFKPPTGCRVRIPNVILSASASPYTSLTVNTTIGTRPEFLTTSVGVIDIDYASCNWYLNLSNAYAVTVQNTAWADNFIVTEPATATTVTNCANGFYTINGQALSITTAYLGGTVTDCRFIRRDSSSNTTQTVSLDDTADWTLTRVRMEMFSSATAVTRGQSGVRTLQSGRSSNLTLTDCVVVGANVTIQNCGGPTVINNLTYCDLHNSSSSSANAQSAMSGSGNTNVSVNGFQNLDISGVETQPYNTVVGFSNALTVKLRNIGTSGTPYDGARNSSANGCAGLIVGGNIRSCKVQRCYALRLRTSCVQDNNEDQDWTVANVYGDYADSRIVNGTNRLTHGMGESANTTNATSSFGTHWMDYFTAATAGAVQIRANEPSSSTAAQCSVTGTSRFDGAGGVSMPTLNDTITWTTPRRVLGHTAFQNVAPTLSGTNTGNFTIEYQIDTNGTGYSAWKTLSAANLSAESISPTTGFLLKIRATVAVGNAGNLLQRILIPTVTTASDQLTLYPLNNPIVGYEDTQSGSTLSIWNDGSSAFLTSGTHSSGDTLATPDWSSDYTAVLRLRKAGWQAVENTITIDEDGQTIPIVQADYATIPDTDPGALGITITDHGASPVSWQSKSWSITIQTTNDSLTPAQVANWINYNISQLATWNGFVGHAWPEMIQPDGTGFKTVRGRLIGSAGAALKGVRVVRNDGTTAVTGFTTMQADDGTTYTVPTYLTAQVTGIISGSRLQVYNVTSATEIYNGVPGTSWSLSYLEGAEFAAGESVRVRVTRTNGTTAYLPINTVVAATAAGLSVSVSQENDTVYNTLAIDGSSVTGFSADYVNDEVNVTVAANFNISDMYAWWAYNLTTSQGIAEFVGGLTAVDVANYRINNSIVDIYIDNTTATNLRQLDNRRIYRADEAYPVKSSGGGGIDVVWRNTILVAETGTSGLTGPESTKLSEIYTRLGLDIDKPITATTTQITATGITIAVTGNGTTTSTLTRQ